MTLFYSPNTEAEIAELRTKLRDTIEAALEEMDRNTWSAFSIQRLKDLMIKHDVLVRRLEGYVAPDLERHSLRLL